jgi:hypothetical protein
MKLEYPYLLAGDQPITSVADYLSARRQFDDLRQKLDAVQLEMKRQRDQGKRPAVKLSQDFDILHQQVGEVRLNFIRRKPNVLISRCPFCRKSIWMKVGIFSLVDEFWYRLESDGREEVIKESRCSHLFCVDGALNLNGHQPSEAKAPLTVTNNTIKMAAEVPFIKPRVLNLRTIVAVVHSFPVADKYTAYPIVYFAKRQPPQEEYCLAWARQYYSAHHKASGQGVVLTGKRTDAQDYELEKWVQRKKLFWLDPADDEHPLVRKPVEAFPYNNVPGRRNPYLMKDGQVTDLPNPTQDSEPENHLEW